jgi:hypothetical protein
MEEREGEKLRKRSRRRGKRNCRRRGRRKFCGQMNIMYLRLMIKYWSYFINQL